MPGSVLLVKEKTVDGRQKQTTDTFPAFIEL